MLTVEDYGVIRRAHRDGMSSRQYIRVLQLLAGHPQARVRQAIEHCHAKGLLDGGEDPAVPEHVPRWALRSNSSGPPSASG